jgi:RNA polymerase sigma factor for flagellar operon FliA
MSSRNRGRNGMREYHTLPDIAGEAQRRPTGGAAAGSLAAVDSELAALWHNYRLTDDKGPLLLHYSPLVAYVACRVSGSLPPSVEMADLVSYGIFGLIDAIDKFEPDRGIRFESYASSRIRGAILDELRNMDWVPRSVRTKIRDVERAYGSLQMTLNRTPTESEVAAELGITVAELRKLSSEVAFANVVPVDDIRHCPGFDDVTFSAAFSSLSRDGRTAQPDDALEAAEQARAVASAINGLCERERAVIDLHYYRGLKLTEIGQLLGVTVARVSQLHARARLALKKTLVAMDV